MAGWQVTEQAITAMNSMSTQLEALASRIHQETERMKLIFEDNRDGLGAHAGDIFELINSIEWAEQNGRRPLDKLKLKLNRAASIRKKHIEDSRYGGNSSSTIKNAETKEDGIRQKAVKEAWGKEKQRVLQGKGTRNWTVGQQAELIEHNRVSGFEGQHMKNVARYPQYAGDSNNIQFLTYEEHYYGAHRGNWKNETNGRFDPATGEMIDGEKDALPDLPEIELTDKYDPSQYELTLGLGRSFGYARHEDIKTSREIHKDGHSNGAMNREIKGHK